MAEGGGIWACMAFAFFCPRFFCPLELRASFVRVAGFDQPTPVPHPRSSRLFFLLTSHRRRSASVSEILNVAPLRSNSLDGCPSSNSESQIRRPKRRDPNPRDQKTQASKTWAHEPPTRKTLGSQPRDRFETSGSSWNTTSSRRLGCLPALRPRTDACHVWARAV